MCLLGWTWRCKCSGRVQRVRPADESCQTPPLYLSFLFLLFLLRYLSRQGNIRCSAALAFTVIHSGIHGYLRHYLGQIYPPPLKSNGNEIGHLYNYYFFLPFSSSQFLILHKCPRFCSHIIWRTEPCETAPSPQTRSRRQSKRPWRASP